MLDDSVCCPVPTAAFVRSWKDAIAVGDGSVGFGLCGNWGWVGV